MQTQCLVFGSLLHFQLQSSTKAASRVSVKSWLIQLADEFE